MNISRRDFIKTGAGGLLGGLLVYGGASSLLKKFAYAAGESSGDKIKP